MTQKTYRQFLEQAKARGHAGEYAEEWARLAMRQQEYSQEPLDQVTLDEETNVTNQNESPSHNQEFDLDLWRQNRQLPWKRPIGRKGKER